MDQPLTAKDQINAWIEQTDKLFCPDTPVDIQAILDGVGLILTNIYTMLELMKADARWQKDN